MTYKKLFPIEYNNKKFMIFIDESDRRTFLEINSKGEYEYPMLEDFIALHNMFNNKEPYICYDIQRFKFKECVKIVKNGVLSLLTVITILNSMPTALAASNVEVQDDKAIISVEPQNKKYIAISENNNVYISDREFPGGIPYYEISDGNDLEKYLGKINITRELIINTINNNGNIPNDIKKIAIEQFEYMYTNYPKANYRTFYENMKLLKVNYYSDEEYCKKFSNILGSGAHFNPIGHEINFRGDTSKSTIAHEIAHTYQHLFLKENDCVISVTEKHQALDEGATDIIKNWVVSSESIGSYKISKEVLEYLLSIADYTYEEYSYYGIQKLLDKCSEIYPDIDFNYISSTLNSLKDVEINQNVSIDKDPIEMYDELFKIALKNIDINNGYDSFINFIDCLSEVRDNSLVDNYFRKYTEELEKIGFFNTEKGKKIKENINKYSKIFEKANSVIYSNKNEFSASLGMINDDGPTQIINKDGTLSNVQDWSEISIDKTIIIKALIMKDNIDEVLINWLKEKEYINPYKYSSIPVYFNGQYLANSLVYDLSIQLGFTTNKNLGFIISNKNGDIIYKSDEKLDNLSNAQPLGDYLLNYLDGLYKKIELSEVLNEDYLRKVQEEKGLFNNIEVIDGKLKIKELETSKQDNQEPESEIKNIIEDNSISEIYMNNEIIAKANVKDLFLTIGKTKDSKIGYILTNRAGMPIYESEYELQELSIPIDFAIYTGPGFSKMYLEDYLNEDYLRNFQKETGMLSNIELVGDKIVIDASPIITIQSNVSERIINSTYKLSKLKVYVNNGVITLSSLSSINNTYDNVIAVEDILRYSNILDEGIPQYRITMEELMDMTASYLNSLENNKLNEGIERK